nr:uncharacterized protein LOC116151782 [Camelus dromedarius]
MEPLLVHRTSGQGSGAAVCIRLGHGPFCLVLFPLLLLLLSWYLKKNLSLAPIRAFDWIQNSVCLSSSPSSLDHHRGRREGNQRIYCGTLKLKKKNPDADKKEAHALVRGILMRYLQNSLPHPCPAPESQFTDLAPDPGIVSCKTEIQETAGVQQPLQSRRGTLRTTLTAAQRSLRPPEASGVCGLSKTGAFFLPFPWRDYQLHLSQKLRLNLLSRSRGSRGSDEHRVRLSASPRGPGEFEMAKVRWRHSVCRLRRLQESLLFLQSLLHSSGVQGLP